MIWEQQVNLFIHSQSFSLLSSRPSDCASLHVIPKICQSLNVVPLTEQAVALIGFSIVHAPQFISREAGVIRHDLNPSSEQVVEGHFYITIGFLECLAALL